MPAGFWASNVPKRCRREPLNFPALRRGKFAVAQMLQAGIDSLSVPAWDIFRSDIQIPEASLSLPFYRIQSVIHGFKKTFHITPVPLYSLRLPCHLLPVRQPNQQKILKLLPDFSLSNRHQKIVSVNSLPAHRLSSCSSNFINIVMQTPDLRDQKSF